MQVSFDKSELQPIIETAVRATLEQVADENAQLGSRLAFSEAEAASLLGIKTHVLRDCRLRGEIIARRVGKSFRYSCNQLVRFMDGEA